jgi:hypothetical protein
MPELVVEGDRRMIEVGPFRLAFTWAGDRWVHSLEHRGRGESSHRVLALSVEGDSTFNDPTLVVSPTYQDLQFQADGPTMQALLVGQSGLHHFSAVFSVEDQAQETPPGWPYEQRPCDVMIKVDVADRCRVPVEELAATYTIDARSDELAHAHTSFVAWDFGPNRLVFEAIDPAKVSLAEAGRRATRVQARAGAEKGTATRRFLYEWSWVPDLRW